MPETVQKRCAIHPSWTGALQTSAPSAFSHRAVVGRGLSGGKRTAKPGAATGYDWFLDYIGLYGSLAGLITVHVIYGLPITTLIFRNYFANIPYEIVEAARIDGAGLWQIFRQIMLPLSLPAFVVVGIFQFTNIWNEFLFGLTVITNPREQPITVALNNLSGSFSVAWNVVMAGAVLAAIPTLVLYVLLGRFFIRGMLAGSMKG